MQFCQVTFVSDVESDYPVKPVTFRGAFLCYFVRLVICHDMENITLLLTLDML